MIHYRKYAVLFDLAAFFQAVVPFSLLQLFAVRFVNHCSNSEFPCLIVTGLKEEETNKGHKDENKKVNFLSVVCFFL